MFSATVKTYLIRAIEVLVCAILQNYSYNTENLKNRISWEGWIWAKKIIFNLQVFPWLDVLLKKGIEMIEKLNPMMEISLQWQQKMHKVKLHKRNREHVTAEDYRSTLSNSQTNPLSGSSIFSSGTAVTLLMKDLIFGG